MEATLDADTLGSFEIMAGVGLTARKDLLDAAEVRKFGAGKVLITQGEPNSTMFMLVEGALAIHLDDIDNEALAIIGAGELQAFVFLVKQADTHIHAILYTFIAGGLFE